MAGGSVDALVDRRYRPAISSICAWVMGAEPRWRNRASDAVAGYWVSTRSKKPRASAGTRLIDRWMFACSGLNRSSSSSAASPGAIHGTQAAPCPRSPGRTRIGSPAHRFRQGQRVQPHRPGERVDRGSWCRRRRPSRHIPPASGRRRGGLRTISASACPDRSRSGGLPRPSRREDRPGNRACPRRRRERGLLSGPRRAGRISRCGSPQRSAPALRRNARSPAGDTPATRGHGPPRCRRAPGRGHLHSRKPTCRTSPGNGLAHRNMPRRARLENDAERAVEKDVVVEPDQPVGDAQGPVDPPAADHAAGRHKSRRRAPCRAGGRAGDCCART